MFVLTTVPTLKVLHQQNPFNICCMLTFQQLLDLYMFLMGNHRDMHGAAVHYINIYIALDKLISIQSICLHAFVWVFQSFKPCNLITQIAFDAFILQTQAWSFISCEWEVWFWTLPWQTRNIVCQVTSHLG